MAIPYDKQGNAMTARILQPEQEYDFGGEVSYVMEIPYKKGGKSYQMGGDFLPKTTPLTNKCPRPSNSPQSR